MTSPKHLSRRHFLAVGTAAAGMAALGPVWAEETVSEGVLANAGPDRWEVLRRLTGDRLLRPGDTGYGKAALPNNLHFRDMRPQGVAYCSTPQMVADVLNWARDQDMPFAIRGGGHSYSGYSSSHDLVIDMREMRAISHDAETGQVRVEAGVLNGQLYSALSKAGRMITHGRCPSVGAAGYLLGGGIGFNMRRLGMAADALTSAEIVTADGQLRTLSSDVNPDLFWAIRGGAGGNFGVNTSFTLNTVPMDETLTVFRMVWRSKTLAVAHALFAAVDAAPVELGTRIALGGVTPDLGARGRQVPVTLLGQYAGSKEDLLEILAPVNAVAAPEFIDVQEKPYWSGQNFLSEPGEPAYFRERSAFISSPPNADHLGEAFEKLQSWPGTGAEANYFFFQTGGRINELAPADTAFVHRDSRFLSVVGISWSEDDLGRTERLRAARDWQDDFYGFMSARGGQGAFQNFPDASLVDWRARYYGANLPRLTEIKAEFDPTNLFRHGQSL